MQGQQRLRRDKLLHQSERCEASLAQARLELAVLKADSSEMTVSALTSPNVIGCVLLLIFEYETYKSFKTSGLSIIRESLIDNVKENGKKGIDGIYA